MIKSLTLLFVLIYAISNHALAQDENKLVTLTASNQGESKEAARQNALRTAIEQAFGAFISSKTEIFNDQLVADQMASVAYLDSQYSEPTPMHFLLKNELINLHQSIPASERLHPLTR